MAYCGQIGVLKSAAVSEEARQARISFLCSASKGLLEGTPLSALRVLEAEALGYDDQRLEEFIKALRREIRVKEIRGTEGRSMCDWSIPEVHALIVEMEDLAEPRLQNKEKVARKVLDNLIVHQIHKKQQHPAPKWTNRLIQLINLFQKKQKSQSISQEINSPQRRQQFYQQYRDRLDIGAKCQ